MLKLFKLKELQSEYATSSFIPDYDQHEKQTALVVRDFFLIAYITIRRYSTTVLFLIFFLRVNSLVVSDLPLETKGSRSSPAAIYA